MANTMLEFADSFQDSGRGATVGESGQKRNERIPVIAIAGVFP